MKKIVSLIIPLLLILSLSGVLFGCTQYHAQGAGSGAVLGGITGALLDRKNPWRGGVIGAAIGGATGATLTDISLRASREAAATGRPVVYRTEDGRGVYRAEPVGYNAQTRCHKVHERVWEKNQMVKDNIREVCKGERLEGTY
ncbi:MAG: glycine zipper 2TM domain-containing protein [Nitrospirae bacterium]|nr:glycine zipper 2TM domain-containing protein [Nitrospirota bacterium]